LKIEDANQICGFTSVNGARLYFEMSGTGKSVVFIHGGLVNCHLWDGQFPQFARCFQTMRYDLRGFGQSESPSLPYSHTEDLRALLQFLGIQQAAIIGLSLGGTIATNFALAYPELVEALVLVGAGLDGYQVVQEKYVDVIQQFIEMDEAHEQGDLERELELTLRVWTDGPNRFPEQVNPQARSLIRRMSEENFLRPKPEAQEKSLGGPPAAELLGELRARTLVVLGAEDVGPILEIGEVLAREIPGASKVLIPEVAHHLPLEKPEEFNRIVLSFLAQ
jgi:3-oxoadipate enol-lactonase